MHAWMCVCVRCFTSGQGPYPFPDPSRYRKSTGGSAGRAEQDNELRQGNWEIETKIESKRNKEGRGRSVRARERLEEIENSARRETDTQRLHRILSTVQSRGDAPGS